MLKTFLLMILTAFFEILGCYLPYLWLKQQGSIWLLAPALLSLIAFVGLLSLHPEASGRVYATYGGIYILIALMWLKWVDKVTLQFSDLIGAAVIFVGILIIYFGWSNSTNIV
ncbi:inner membrane protein [Gammaproteobacteria bacterium]|nr:inner membrane protein [Gammaproteobacteria bacterium]